MVVIIKVVQKHNGNFNINKTISSNSDILSLQHSVDQRNTLRVATSK